MTDIRFDKWLDLYAARTQFMQSSAVRDLFLVTSRPDITSFAGGMPDTRAFPFEQVVEATAKVMREEGAAALQYGSSDGHMGLKEQIARIMEEEGIEASPDEIIVTDGGQQALDLVAKVFIDRGDRILLEAPSYIGALQAFSGYEPQPVCIPLDEHGLRTDALAAELDRLSREGVKPKFLYVVPNFHNPAGATLSHERRLEILDLAHKHNLLLFEDNPYGRLRFEGEDIPSLRAHDDSLIYISTFSKIFSPGVRLGWISAPKPILDRINTAKQAANLCTSSFAQRVAHCYMTDFPWKDQVEKLKGLYRERRDTMLEALVEFFPEGSTWTRPEGGLFVWATLPDGIDTDELLADAIREAKVAYVPGRAFFADCGGERSMRLNFSYAEKETVYDGIKRLGAVAKKQLALYRSLTRKFMPARPKE